MSAIMGSSIYFIDQIDTVTKSSQLVSAIESDMLTLRKHEKDFFSRFDLKYQENFNTTFDALQTHIQQLATALADAGILFAKQQQLTTTFNEYGQQFKKLVTLQEKIGLNKTSGQNGALRSAANKLETRIYQLEDNVLLTDLLLLRRSEKDFILRQENEYADAFTTKVTEIQNRLNGPAYATISRDINNMLTPYQQEFTQYVLFSQQKGLTANQGLTGEMRNTVKKTEMLLAQEADKLKKQTAEIRAEAKSTLMILGISITIIISALVFFLAKQISARLNQVSKAMEEISNGDGDLRVALNSDGNDEITALSHAFNAFVSKIHKTISIVANSALTLASTAENMSIVTENAKTGTFKQQQDITQIAVSIEEMNVTVQEVSQHTVEAENTALLAKQKSHQGGKITTQNIQEITQLSSEVENASSVINNLITHSQDIGDVLNVIQGIAAQTNLLALNAAIEAARAGESGRGFAVVADEVRNLALRTQEATKEILTITGGIQRDAETATQVMESSGTQATNALSQTKLANDALLDITAAVEHVSEMNSQIAVASEQQSQTSLDISHRIVAISNICDESAAGMKQLSVANQELTTMTQELKALVGEFKL
tara:strand:+ start:40956 stop:42767 length:1812 start_codon:yes stop_codon:yes gene_type:complete